MTSSPTLADIFKALGHPFRVEIIRLLSQEEQACVCHLEAITKKRQAYISQHLTTLREVGLVIDQRIGMNVFYSLKHPCIAELIDTAHNVANTISDSPIPLQPLKTSQDIECSCPTCSTEAGPVIT